MRRRQHRPLLGCGAGGAPRGRARGAPPGGDGGLDAQCDRAKSASIFVLNLPLGPKYQNTGKIPKFISGSKRQNIGCIDADFDGKGGIFQHFSSSFGKISWKRLKTPRKKPSHQNSDFFLTTIGRAVPGRRTANGRETLSSSVLE